MHDASSRLLQMIFDNGADAGGLAYWNGQLANGSSTRTDAATALIGLSGSEMQLG